MVHTNERLRLNFVERSGGGKARSILFVRDVSMRQGVKLTSGYLQSASLHAELENAMPRRMAEATPFLFGVVFRDLNSG